MHRQMIKPWVGVAAIAIAAAVPQVVHAGAKSYVHSELRNYLFKNRDQNEVLEIGTDILIVDILESVTNTATRLSGPGADSKEQTLTDNSLAGGLKVDVPLQCVGTGCGPAENTFTMGDFNADEYARSDSLVDGTGLDTDGSGSPATGVDAREVDLVAEAITQAGANDSTTTAYTSTSRFTIIPQEGMVLGLDFDFVNSYFLGLHEEAAGLVDASMTVVFSVALDGVPEPVTTSVSGPVGTQFQRQLQLGTPGTNFSFVDTGSFAASTANALLADEEYDVSITFTARANLNASKQVPEPGVLSLLGLGLLGLGAGRARCKRGR